MAQQAAYGNMGGMSMGIPMQQMSAQAQMAAMRGRLQVGLLQLLSRQLKRAFLTCDTRGNLRTPIHM